MRQTDKSLQSEKFKQVVGGLGNPLGKSPAPDRIRSPRDLDRSFPCWPGSGYFGTARVGVLYTAEGPRPFQLSDPRPPQWGKVSFIATSTGDDHAARSNAQILEQACAENLCTKKRAPPYQ